MPKKYFIITFGCQMNKSDSERIASVLKKIEYKPASQINEADLIVVNMCSVRQPAVDRIYGKVNEFNELKRKGRKIRTLLTGCIPKKDINKFKDKFDYILNIKSLNYWKKNLKKDKYFFYPPSRDLNFCKEFSSQYLKLEPVYSSKFSNLIPISIGCDNFCSFCIVPYVRGPLINRNHKEILKEVKKAIKNGVKEIWLLGQNVNSYKSGSTNFSKLLEMIAKIPGNFWIRFTSPHPKDFSNKLIETMKSCEKVTNYLNLPVQAGDNEILRKMNRPYTVQHYKNLIKKIRNKIPDICLSTDVIVGFPGETKKQFENTCKLFKEIKFDMAYIAQYSPRPGTAAEKMEDNVSKKEKKRRAKILTKILKKTALENNKKYIGQEVEVLVMEHKTHNMKHKTFIGKTRSYKTVMFKVSNLPVDGLVGQFVKVKIVGASPWGLKG